MRIGQLLFFLSIPLLCRAQQKTLSEEEFMAVVSKYHPVARQAALDVKIAQAQITASRGAFDPVLNAGNTQKDFGGIKYYNVEQAEIKVPAWYGIDFYAGTESIEGSRINSEETKGSIGYIGISIPLIQNFVIDKRRAAVNQAKLFRELTIIQQRIAVNDLTLEALQTYWEWWEQYHLYALMQKALSNAEKRFNMVRTSYNLGEYAAIDTLEALTQVQSFAIKKSEAYAAFAKAQLQLSVFLWRENNQQYDLPYEVAPQQWQANAQFVTDELLTVASSHPEVAQYNVKLKDLEINRRLKFQSLLPQVNLKYNRISYELSGTLKGGWLQNDYRYGLSLSLPLRLSQGRGEYRQAKLKIERAQIEQTAKQATVFNKVKQFVVEWQQTHQQLAMQQAAVINYNTMQRAEETKFSNGESSLFLLNARELKTIEAMQKEIELKAKTRNATNRAKWAAGIFSSPL